ncbi:RiboL-PSP-HEPN domain-containing protein [Candidatus Magnetomoraceae bacterium gMMP-15]
MNNRNAKQLIDECNEELNQLKNTIKKLGTFNNIVPFLTKYAIIKVSGTIEQSFKIIIADFCNQSNIQQTKNYVDNTFRNSSLNPSLDNIYRSLKIFDKEWNKKFKLLLNNEPNFSKLKTSIRSLNNLRNSFAHGGNPKTTIDDIIEYFNDSCIIIQLLDNVVR